jgi:hypothetical protein
MDLADQDRRIGIPGVNDVQPILLV